MDTHRGVGRVRRLAAATLLACLSFGILRAEELRCERIMVGACQNLVYDMTIASAPETALDYLTYGGAQPSAGSAGNGSLGGNIRTWLDAERLIASLRPVIDSGCSKQALFLFCSSLFPLCSPTAPRPVHPCRSLCEQVRRDCFGEPPSSKLWPAYLDCRALPQPEKHELCMQVPSDATGSVEHGGAGAAAAAAAGAGAGAAPPAGSDSDAVGKGWSISNLTALLQHPGAAGAAQGGGATSWPERILLPGPDKHLFKVHGGASNRTGAGGGTPRAGTPLPQLPCPVNYSLEYDRCVPRCGPTVDALYSQRQKELIESWTLVLSAVCFIFTFTSLVTFWTKAAKLEYPDRPILFMTLCYNLLGLCYLERTILHSPRRLEAPAEQLLTLDAPVPVPAPADCSITSQCLAYYILKHYLLLSASSWWLIYGLCWYLSTAKQWSCEALERKSGLFHVLAWVVPFAAPIGALLRGHIQRFELTGFCTARGFTELPALLLLLLGAALVCLALAALARLRLCWNQRAPHLSRVFGRVLTFAVCYLLPALSATVCMMLERVEHALEPCSGDEGAACATQQRAQLRSSSPHFSMLPTALRLALTLLGGGFVGVWLWSRQTTTDGPGAPAAASKKSATAVASAHGPHAGYYPARDLTLPKGAKAPAKSGPGDARPGGQSRRGGPHGDRCGMVVDQDGPLLGGQRALAKDYSSQTSRERSGSGRTSRSGVSAISPSPYRTTDRATTAAGGAGGGGSGGGGGGGGKMQKYCYVYRPCSGRARSEQGARPLQPDASESLRSGAGRRSQGPGAGGGGEAGLSTASGSGSSGGYMPVRVHRSLRAVPVSMITRI